MQYPKKKQKMQKFEVNATDMSLVKNPLIFS